MVEIRHGGQVELREICLRYKVQKINQYFYLFHPYFNSISFVFLPYFNIISSFFQNTSS